MRNFLLLLICFITVTACNIRKAVNPTAREKYERNFKGPAHILQSWQQAHQEAFQNHHPITLPITFTARLHDTVATVLSYQFAVSTGQQLILEINKQYDSTEFFIELYKLPKAGQQKPDLINTITGTDTRMAIPITQPDSLLLIVQPAISNQSLFRLRIYSQPAYLFPVAGKGNAAVSSFWGAGRDGGSRRHEGIDIIAPRGTPLLAVSDGRITNTGNRGLGGKQVWLRENVYNKSVYYAHLDSIMVQDGQIVKKGDTLGLVGNTGNAITTVPHLHFGVYGNGGAVDPYLFVKQLPVPAFGDTLLTKKVTINKNNSEVKKGPGTAYSTLQLIPKNDTVNVLAQTGNWYFIQHSLYKGFINLSNTREIKNK